MIMITNLPGKLKNKFPEWFEIQTNYAVTCIFARFLCTKIFLNAIHKVTSSRIFSKMYLLDCKESVLSMMSSMVVGFFEQLFNSNGDHKCSNSPPKSRNKLANVRVLVYRRMVSPCLKSLPRIFPNFNCLP